MAWRLGVDDGVEDGVEGGVEDGEALARITPSSLASGRVALD